MNRKQFGALVAALRQDLGWTQFQLAEYAGLEDAVISQIERGVKRHFDPELLFQLMNALQLTTLERREFSVAASGLTQAQLVRQRSPAISTDVFNVKRVLEKVIEFNAEVRLPAFVADVFGDIVSANHILLSLFKLPPHYEEEAGTVPAGYSTIRFDFGKNLMARSYVTDNWDRYAVYSMRSFREKSLRYRAHPYFKYLMSVFRNQSEFPLFERYWKIVSSLEEDRDVGIEHFAYTHVEFGPVKYIASSSASMSSFGELFLVQYLPVDRTTCLLFESLAQKEGQVARRYAPWPDKQIP